jgi:(1->4)-alpha-D-glucan 1-alpha-D-glucosylmutase
MFNSLSHTLLKIAAPGVPDFYQGTEIWNFSLVDPDNRRPADYERCKRALDSLRASEGTNREAMAEDLLRNAEDGRIKLFITSRALNYRREHRELFERGEYTPLQTAGDRERHAVAFNRRHNGKIVIVAAARFFSKLADHALLPVGGEVWGNTAIVMNEELAGCYRDVFTGRSVCAQSRQQTSALMLSEVFMNLPIALLENV